mmetsp:Transcript_2378/g.7288  ORF Transcript_2378/g.7288 Transcript_2378/m.7288 type:complete len:110 (-) Transcript_2378:40-369(-)
MLHVQRRGRGSPGKEKKFKGMKSWKEEDYRAAIREEGVKPSMLKQFYNNLGVIVFHRATQEGSDEAFKRIRREAVELLRVAVNLSPDWAEARHNLGYVEVVVEHLCYPS